MLQLPW